jgi:hypothetical protein
VDLVFKDIGSLILNNICGGLVPVPPQGFPAWAHGGYNEIQNPPRKYTLIDREQLIACCGLGGR